MKRINTIIVDDEPLAREGIRMLLEKDPDIFLAAEFRSGKEALEYIQNKSADLMFIDIQMPGMSGFDTVSCITPECRPVIIFVTAFDQYALQAFKIHAIDYIMKPISDEDFSQALSKAKEYIRLKAFRDISFKLSGLLQDLGGIKEPDSNISAADEQGDSIKYIDRFPVTLSGRTFFIRTDSIDWIEAYDYYVKIHESGKSHLYRETMNKLETRLNPEKFVRVHRSAIVNIDRIREIETFFNGEYMIILNDNTRIKLSRSRKDHLKKLLNLK